MKTKKYVYGRALAWLCTGALLFAAVSCADDDESNDSEPTPPLTYEVGTMVDIRGKQWLVIKNTETPEKVAAESTEHHYYPNKAADEYRDRLIEKHEIRKPYVLVFNETPLEPIETTKAYWEDEYRILRDGKILYQITYRWKKDQISNDTAATITTDRLRQEYDPSIFRITNLTDDYGDDVSKKFSYRYDFKYTPEEPISYTDSDLKVIYEYKDYVSINGETAAQYTIQDRITYKSYLIHNPRSSYGPFFELRYYPELPGYCGLLAYTQGLIDDDSTGDEYRTDIRIPMKYTDTGFEGSFTVKTTTPPAQESSQTFRSLTADGADKYVTVSEETTPCNSMTVPAEITVTTHFAYKDSELDEFTAITFVPKAEGDYVIYVPKAGVKSPYDFIDKFEEAYYSIFDTSAATSN